MSEASQRKSNNFYTAIQGKGISVNGMVDQKKLILTKLFKGQKAGPPGSAPGTSNYVPVAASFNDQLMNQTNFGYNPNRNTLASH